MNNCTNVEGKLFPSHICQKCGIYLQKIVGVFDKFQHTSKLCDEKKTPWNNLLSGACTHHCAWDLKYTNILRNFSSCKRFGSVLRQVFIEHCSTRPHYFIQTLHADKWKADFPLQKALQSVWTFSLIFCMISHCLALDIYQNMLISLILTSYDHFQFRLTLGMLSSH